MLLALAFPFCLLHYLFECEQLPSVCVCPMDSSGVFHVLPACVQTLLSVSADDQDSLDQAKLG